MFEYPKLGLAGCILAGMALGCADTRVARDESWNYPTAQGGARTGQPLANRYVPMPSQTAQTQAGYPSATYRPGSTAGYGCANGACQTTPTTGGVPSYQQTMPGYTTPANVTAPVPGTGVTYANQPMSTGSPMYTTSQLAGATPQTMAAPSVQPQTGATPTVIPSYGRLLDNTPPATTAGTPLYSDSAAANRYGMPVQTPSYQAAPSAPMTGGAPQWDTNVTPASAGYRPQPPAAPESQSYITPPPPPPPTQKMSRLPVNGYMPEQPPMASPPMAQGQVSGGWPQTVTTPNRAPMMMSDPAPPPPPASYAPMPVQ